MGSKLGRTARTVSLNELLQDPLSKTQRIYLIKEWSNDANICREMEHSLVLMVVAFSDCIMEEKLQHLFVPFNGPKLKLWKHSQLYKKGIVANAPSDAILSAQVPDLSTFDDFLYVISRNEGHHFFKIRIKVVTEKYDIEGYRIYYQYDVKVLNWNGTLRNHVLHRQEEMCIGRTTFVLSKLLELLYNTFR